MKKIVKNISRVLFSLLLIFSLFSTINVLAEEVIFQITNISVKEKSSGVTVNDVSISGGELNNDIIFDSKDDYIKYDITIKNNSDEDYIIKSISDNNDSEYLEYTYDDLSNVKVEAGNDKTFELQIKYIKETEELTINDKNVSLTLTYESVNGVSGTQVINNNSNNTKSNNITNPNTGDNIIIYIVFGIISLIGLCVTTVSRRNLNKSLMSILVFSMVLLPLGVRANSDKFLVVFKNNILSSYNTITYNGNGGTFNGNNKNVVRYKKISESSNVKISHTENIDDTGKQLSNYGNYWDFSNVAGSDRGDTDKAHVITIDGASSLVVDVYYNSESVDYDGLFLIEGDHPDYFDYSDSEFDALTYYEFGGEQTGTYTLNGNELTNMGHDTLIISGNSVTFDFYSDSEDCGNGYGYYATVRENNKIKVFDTVKEPTKEGFDFKGWYTNSSCSTGEEFNINSVSGNVEVYAKWKNPNLYELGDEYCIGPTECFYVIRMLDDNHVVLYSKFPYNLDNNLQETSPGGALAFEFSRTNYWAGDGVNYPIDVYDGDNYLKEYINNYVDYLKTYKPNIEGRLLNYDDLVALNVDFSKINSVESLANSPEWLRDGNFGTFTSVATNDYDIYRIQDDALYETSYSRYAMTGVLPVLRPVIVLKLN